VNESKYAHVNTNYSSFNIKCHCSANVVNQDPTSSITAETTTTAGTSEQSSQQPSQQQPQQQSSNQEQQLPDGVDPSFLAALPEDMRDEVIAEQLRSIDDLIRMFIYRGDNM